MYKSPIELMYGQMDTMVETFCHQLEKKIDGDICEAILKIGINVDRDELLRALQYDRGQYEKGYRDGKADAMASIVHCKDCEHWQEHDGEMYCVCWANLMTDTAADDFCSYGERRTDNA